MFTKSGLVWVVIGGVLGASTAGHSQDTPDFFRQNCMNCHTIGGGRLTGPDLKGVTTRQEREWLIGFMMNPKSYVDRADPYAVQLLSESRGVVMPVLPGMTRDRCERLLDLIAAESELEESEFKGLQISEAPFTDADRALGRKLFQGRVPLAAGGAACIGCHSMHDTPPLGGGLLAADRRMADLTSVYERLEGRKALSAWLVAPATATMQPIFKAHPLTSDEIHALVAYFESAAGQTPADYSVNRVAFLLTGLAGAAAVLFGFDALWKQRFHNVRRDLVERSLHRGPP